MPVDSGSPGSTSHDNPEIIVGATAPVREVRRLVELAAERSCDVLINGDAGTGKALVARAIHARSGGAAAFHKVEGASPAGVLDSDLFGAKPPGTTVFLREVGDLSAPLQTQLRLALEERDRQRGQSETPFAGVRLICSSTRDLTSATRRGAFESALHHRLSTFTIDLPPLNSRRDDIPLLLEHFLRLLRFEIGHQVEGFSPAAVEVLVRRSWVGNVRELYEYVRTTVVLSSGKVIQPMDLWLPRAVDESGTEPWQLGYRELRKRVLLRFEADFVGRVLKASGGNVSMAARLAKIDRKHLWRLIQRTGIKLEKFDK